MTKSELVEKIAAGAKLSKVDAGRALESALDAIKEGLRQNQNITLIGFGTFSVSKRKERMGRNPKTGEAIKIAASKSPKFTPGKALKNALK